MCVCLELVFVLKAPSVRVLAKFVMKYTGALLNKVYFGGTLHDLSFGGLCKYVFVCYSSGSTKDLNRRGHVR